MIDEVEVEYWPAIERAHFWARVYLHPRREFPRGPYLPPHPTDLKLVQHLHEVAGMMP